MRQRTVAAALVIVFVLVIGGWHIVQPIRAAQATGQSVASALFDGAIGGVIRDGSTALPLAGANIQASGSVTAVATSDPSGSYSLGGLPDGSFEVVASHADYASQNKTILVSSGSTSSGNFSLDAVTPTVSGTPTLTATASVTSTATPTAAPGSIEGIVQEDSPPFASLAGASLQARGSVTAVATTDATGSYVLENLPPGAYDVDASQVGYASESQSIHVGAGLAALGNFKLAALTPTSTDVTGPQPPTATPTSTDVTGPQPPTATPTSSSTISATTTPSGTLTITPTPCGGSVQVVQNPSFENGSTSWALTASAELSTAEAADGTHSMILAGYADSTDAISQTIVVPQGATAGTLRVSWWMFSSDDPTQQFDQLAISVLDPNSTAPTPTPVTQLVVWNTAVQSTWIEMNQDIPNVAQFAGSSLTLQVVGLTNHTGQTVWYVDNVRVDFACASPVASPTTTPVTSATNTPSESPIPTITPTPTISGPVSVFLPLILKQPTPSPSPTLTVTITPTVCSESVQVVQNPSFENGSTYWTLEAFAAVSSAEASDGSHSMTLGGYDNSTDAISQSVAVPPWATSGTIRVSWWMFSGDDPTKNYDALLINVLDPNSSEPTPTPVTQYVVWNTATQQTWTDVSQDIPNVAQFAGSVLTVQIAGITDATAPTFWYIDNVQAVFSCGSAATAKRNTVSTPTPTPASG